MENQPARPHQHDTEPIWAGTSHLLHRGLCLFGSCVAVDDWRMESNDRIFRHTCAMCERPALTFDLDHRPMCSRHATVFIPAQRVVAADDDQWWDDLASKKAST